MSKRFLRLICLFCICLMLCGCASRQESPAVSVTLPPVSSKLTPRNHDTNQDYRQTVLLYLPSPDGTRLVAVPENAQFTASRHAAEVLCEMLFSHKGTDDAVPLGGSVSLHLSETDPIEVSGNVATVNLTASALRLSHAQLHTLGQALANTLCQFGNLDYVNILIAGVQPGLDIAATLPAGSFQPNTREDLSALWARASAPQSGARRAFAATLYYPAPSGKGILCEARTLSFSDLSIAGMARTLMAALSAGAEYLPALPKCPDLNGMLLSDPVLEETGGMRRLMLHFDENLNTRLIDAGITRSVMVSSLVCTLTTFIPGLDGVEIHIGNEPINAITPSGTFSGAGETIFFTDGLMQRKNFIPFLLAHSSLYFANAQGKLVQSARPAPFYEAYNIRTIIGQLMQGPQSYDSIGNLSATLPQGLRDADLLGVSLENETLVLNFSQQLIKLCQGMTARQEQLMVYSLVNTLCELPGVNRVAFFIMGEQPESFAGSVFLPGDFLPNYHLIQ